MTQSNVNDKPLVSVIIPTYNYARFLGETLQSMLSQSYCSLEVIVVNDGSTDETLDVIRRFEQDKRLIVYTQSNQGAIKAVNKGVELSRGDYIATCGGDDLWNVDHVKLLMDGFGQHPEAGLLFDNGEYFHDSSESGKKLVVPAAKSKELANKAVSLRDIFTKNWITGCTFIVRREVLNRVGLFNPALYMTGDLHHFYRIAASCPIYYVDYIGAKVRIHQRNMTVLQPHYEFGVRSLEDLKEHYPEVVGKIGSRIFARKLGRKYFRLACYYEQIGEFEKAAMAFKKAFLTRRSRPRYYWGYLRVSCRRLIKNLAYKSS